ncbi:MAG: hypothetical protein ACK5M3_15255 [Dysgonomonas sp.]
MADLDNGLPPEGTDTTTNDINSVLIGKSEVTENGTFNLSSVLLETEDVADLLPNQISSVLIAKEASSYSLCMFL